MIWMALAGCVLAAVILCAPSVVRALSRRTTPPRPPERPSGLRLGLRHFPYPDSPIPPGTEAEGRLVRLRILAPGTGVFTLRHMWTSLALRLPGAGLALDGSIVADDGTAQVSVFAPWNTILVAGVPWCLGAVGIMVSLAVDPRTDVIVFGVLWLSFALLTWRNARRAATAVAQDAIATLRNVAVPRVNPQ